MALFGLLKYDDLSFVIAEKKYNVRWLGNVLMNDMAKPVKRGGGRRRGQVMVEYLLVLLSVVLMYFMLNILWHAFNAYGGRALDLITWKYP